MEPVELPTAARTVAPPRSFRALASAIAVVFCLGVVAAITSTTDAPAAAAPATVEDVARLRGAGSSAAGTSFRMAMQVRVAGQEVDATFAVDADQQAEGVFDFGPLGTIDVLADRTVVYLPTLDGSAWTGFRLTDIETVDDAAVLAGQDPLAWLDALAGPEQVEVLGADTVRDDVATTRYHVEIPLADLLGVTAKILPDAPQVSDDDLDALGAAPVRIDVWIDDAGLLRELEQVMEFSSNGQRVEMTTTFEIYDIGAPIDVQPPTPDRIVGVVDSSGFDPAGRYAGHLAALLTSG